MSPSGSGLPLQDVGVPIEMSASLQDYDLGLAEEEDEYDWEQQELDRAIERV